MGKRRAALIGLMALGGCPAGGLQDPHAVPAAGLRYDAASGRCVDDAGRVGFNARTLEEIARSGDGDCVTLAGRDLAAEVRRIPEWPGGLGEASYRGADLRGTVFPPYDGPGGEGALDGADLRGARDAYGMPIQGRVDAHTRYDSWCVVERESTRILCAEP